MPKIVDDVLELFKYHSKQIRDAFLRAISDIKNSAVLADLVRFIKDRTISLAVSSLRITSGAFSGLLEAIRASVFAAGNHMAGLISKVKVAGKSLFARFNMADQKVKGFLTRDTGEALIERIVDEQIALARKAIADGIRDGISDRQIAEALIGKLDRSKGGRRGGVVGLVAKYEEMTSAARKELEGADYKAYLKRELRDKRFDKLIDRAVREDRKLKPSEIDAITSRYTDRLLEYRAGVIGENEAQSTIMFSRYRAVGQLIESGQVQAYQVQKVWRSVQDERVRYTHVHLNLTERNFDEPFVSRLGNRMMFPKDRSLGARREDWINCRCRLDFKIGVTDNDFFAELV